METGHEPGGILKQAQQAQPGIHRFGKQTLGGLQEGISIGQSVLAKNAGHRGVTAEFT